MSSTEQKTIAPPTGMGTAKVARGARQRFSRRRRAIITVVNLALFALVWETVPVVLDIPPLFLPRLSEVLGEISEMHSEGILIDNVLVSLRVYLMGMASAIILSIPLGLVLGGVKILDRVVSPYLWVIYTTPLIILMPLILLWVGINDTARVLLVFISAVPAIVVVVMEGVKTVDNSLLRAAQSFGADRRRLFTHVVLPSTIPFIGTGVKMGVSRGLIGLFVGELFTSADGIGYIISLSQKVFNTPRIYAMLAMFITFSLIMVGTSQYVERKLSVWRATSTV
jgi:ABC-type nitrate/sulfonate/bicarbonate transport system permease component